VRNWLDMLRIPASIRVKTASSAISCGKGNRARPGQKRAALLVRIDRSDDAGPQIQA